MRLTTEQKEANKLARQEANKLAKETARITSEQSQRAVKEINISIEWKKSRTWGSNPHLTAQIRYIDGGYDSFQSTCSGCGYDKESTVVADVFNAFLKYRLWQLGVKKDTQNLPYGIHCYSENHPHFGGGIGIDCYKHISEFIGGTFKRVASGKTFDVYQYTTIP